MPRLQVYLPDDLYQQVKARKLPASELLQDAVRAEVRRHELLDATDEYLEELRTEAGEPTSEEWMEAEALANRVRAHYDEAAQRTADVVQRAS